jgi:radical SAM family uncharacterized protein/radical SAM-linked protein
MNIESILPFVEKPSRYIGGEINAIRKDRQACRLSIALAFPDTYEVGMSHLGFQILYAIINNRPDLLAERFYAPWPDMEKRMRDHRIPLSSMESQTPLGEFDIAGFSLQYELSYTNVLNMLDLSGIPLRCANRGESHPVVIAGGPCAFNPEPMAPFIDAFVIGEGEEAITELADAIIRGKEKGYGRAGQIESLAAIEGIYVPSVHKETDIIKKRIIRDLNLWRYPEAPIVPLMKTVHDRVTLEIARGCTRGCRFCQAGMVWRPVRERSMENVNCMADNMLCSTGYDELSLLSLSSGDYTLVDELLSSLMERYHERKIAIGLPSLRVETLRENMIEQIRRVRKTSFTLAPEAGTQRLRNIINKGNSEEELLVTTARVFDAGWKAVKLYFMLGLPEESEQDIEGIVDLGFKVLRTARKNRGQVTISLSTFVPKPHTPFQWHAQISLEETRRKQDYFKKNVRHKNIGIKWHDGRMSFLEGIFSRGDRATGDIIEAAFLAGCRFDGWSDLFRYDLWQEALSRKGLSFNDELKAIGFNEHLPWDRIDCGVKKSLLIDEKEKSIAGELTADCRIKGCYNCGVCDFKTVSPVKAADAADKSPCNLPSTDDKSANLPSVERRFLICFTKKGTSRFLSHLELSAAIIRSIQRSGLSFVFTQGFHPHPKISFAFATAVGMESHGEYAEIRLRTHLPASEISLESINPSLPPGVAITSIKEVSVNSKALSDTIRGFSYLASMPEDFFPANGAAFDEAINRFFTAEEFLIERTIKDKSVRKDIRPLVTIIEVDRNRTGIMMSVAFSQEGTVRPIDIMTKVLGIDDEIARACLIAKTETLFR